MAGNGVSCQRQSNSGIRDAVGKVAGNIPSCMWIAKSITAAVPEVSKQAASRATEGRAKEDQLQLGKSRCPEGGITDQVSV